MKKTALIIFILFTAFLQAQNLYVLTPAKEPVRMGGKFLFLRDASHKMNLDEALKSTNYEANTDDVPNYDVTKDAIWGKIKFTCTENADWYIAFDQPFNNIEFYQKKGNSPWMVQKINSSGPQDMSEYNGHVHIKLNVSAGDTTLFLFRVCDYEPLQLNISVAPLEAFTVAFHNTDMYNGICFGVLLMMLIYNLYLFGIQKQRIYLYYVLYVFCNAIFLAVFAGYFYHLPSALRSLILFDPVLFPMSFGIFLILFTLDLFKGLLPKKTVLISNFFIAVVVVTGFIGVTSEKHLAFNITRGLGLILGILCMSAGIRAWLKGSTAAKFYVFGFGAYLSGLAFLILSGHVIPANSFAIMAVVTGSMIECVFLSFAQADKIKRFQLEKEKAQHEVIEQVQKNEKLVREQNVVLEQKVKERTAELAEKNKEITDSIQYAKRIQGTLLASETELRQNIPNHFILFKPKDIVSGDFYWSIKKPEAFYLAVCDSTGHGVPGAFMSLLNITFLNEAIKEKNISQPNEVFNYVRSHLINSISRDGGRDGMDGILIKLSGSKLTYAAANNDILLVRGSELIELASDKMPVGQGEVMDSFTLHEVQLQKGDMLYLFTDGYADQFGGPKGKKFKYKQLLESLVAIASKPLEEQQRIMEETFENWKGNLEQIDDVLGIGIRL